VRALVIVAVLGSTALAKGHHGDPAKLGEAFRAYDRGDLAAAKKLAGGLVDTDYANRDYVLWLRGMVALRTDDVATATKSFKDLGTIKGSRFAREVPWRLADCAWEKGDRAAAAKAYGKLITETGAEDVGDVGTAMWRIAEANPTAAAYRALAIAHPAHPLAERAEAKMLALGGPPLTPAEHIARAEQMSNAHLWDQAVAELALVPPGEEQVAHDYWLGTTLFDMRRRYGDAATLLLGVYPKMGDHAAEAMFHGARALSRADKDDDAIAWYHKVVAAYPHTAWAQEAQFLSGWLDFNRGRYKQAIPPLEDSLRRYPKTKWVDDALWFLGMSHYFLGEWAAAKDKLEALAKRGGALEGGKGVYWLARIEERLGDTAKAKARYTEVATQFPFSWYALLAHARLKKYGVTLPPVGASPRGPGLAATWDPTLAKDELIVRADELIAAGMGVDAGLELARDERGMLKRHDRSQAFALLLDRYVKAGNYNRPWMLAVSYSGSALDGPPTGDAQRWWENAYPRAYRDLVEKYQDLGKNPEGYLYSIMRKESGFDPHDLSYADAQGLLQMIPPTTMRVAKALDIAYDPGKLYEPAYNIETGSWYIGHLLQKFRGQIPLGAGSFNSGPRPVMKWIDEYGNREIDELVELVPYTQTREYMKKVTENFARYRYLYNHEVYEQPLTVEKYVVDQLTY
jgi:soluble lytic murein transglycosylase